MIATVVAIGVSPSNAAAADPVVYAAGDIACAPGDPGSSTTCHERRTSDIVVNGGAARALAIGDLQYDSATLSNLQNSYDHTWGRFKSITSPSLGNHEGSGAGYFDYFYGSGVNSGPFGARGKGFYSFDVGTWHLIALNSNCSRVPCSAGSEQEQWLRADLALHQNACTLAFWHHPRFSSGHDGDNTFMQPLWQDLYNANADVALVGHSHDYERFAPQNASGALDRTTGIREFVVGTGGAFFTGWTTPKPNSEVRQNNTFGVLKLTLHPTGYDWQFVPEAGKTFTDSGSGACHGGGTSPPPPPPASGTTIKVASEADARTYEASPGTNYGTSYLRADGGGDPDVDSYLRFTVSGVLGPIQSAKLRLYAYSPTADGPAVFTTATTWSESTITWSNRPATTSGATDDKGAIATNSWVEYDVSPFVTGNGTYSFRLATTSSDGVDFYSREHTDPALRPELVLSVGT